MRRDERAMKVAKNGNKYLLIAAVLAGFCIVVSPVGAADESVDVINYAYSNWIGSGFYKFGIALSSKDKFPVLDYSICVAAEWM
jgi:hypothetical protein